MFIIVVITLSYLENIFILYFFMASSSPSLAKQSGTVGASW